MSSILDAGKTPLIGSFWPKAIGDRDDPSTTVRARKMELWHENHPNDLRREWAIRICLWVKIMVCQKETPLIINSFFKAQVWTYNYSVVLIETRLARIQIVDSIYDPYEYETSISHSDLLRIVLPSGLWGIDLEDNELVVVSADFLCVQSHITTAGIAFTLKREGNNLLWYSVWDKKRCHLWIATHFVFSV